MSGCGTNQEPCFTTVDVLDYFRGGGHVATNAEGEEVVVLTECDSGPGDGSGGWEQYLIQTESMQACANYVSTNYPVAIPTPVTTLTVAIPTPVTTPITITTIANG